MMVAKNDNKGAIGILFGIQRGLRQIMDETEEHFLDQFEIDSAPRYENVIGFNDYSEPYGGSIANSVSLSFGNSF